MLIQAATVNKHHLGRSGEMPDFRGVVAPSLTHLRIKSFSGYPSSYKNIQAKSYVNQKYFVTSIDPYHLFSMLLSIKKFCTLSSTLTQSLLEEFS